MAEQVKFYVDDEMHARLLDLAERYGRRAGATIAKEVLEQYLDFWEQAEEVRAGVIAEQRAGLLEVGGVYARGKPGKGEIEKVKQDAISRTKKKR